MTGYYPDARELLDHGTDTREPEAVAASYEMGAEFGMFVKREYCP